MNGLERLRRVLSDLPPAMALVSGGLDSRLLAQTAWSMGRSLTALHFTGPHMSPAEQRWALEWAKSQGRDLLVVDLGPLDIPLAAANDRLRCLHCKRGLMERAWREARELGLDVVLDGSNASDAMEHRPGRRALEEYGILSPLAMAGLDKPAVRAAAEEIGLAWPDQPARPCLMTRLPYAAAPSAKLLQRVGEVEDALEQVGLGAFRLRLSPPGSVALHIQRFDRGSEQGRGPNQTLLAAAQRILEEMGLPHTEIRLLAALSGFFDKDAGEPGEEVPGNKASVKKMLDNPVKVDVKEFFV